MKRVVSLVLSAIMLMSLGITNVMAFDSTVSSEGTVYAYTSEDFEAYALNTEIISAPSSGESGHVTTADGKLQGYYDAASVSYQVVEETGNRVLKITEQASAANHAYLNVMKPSAIDDTMDYFVLALDIKNEGSAFNNIQLLRGLRINGTSLGTVNASGGDYSALLVGGLDANWHKYMLIGDKANSALHVVLDGKYIGSRTSYSFATDTTFYIDAVANKNNMSTKSSFYLDNIEAYGVKSATHTGSIGISYSDSKLTIDSAAPLKSFAASNISVTGGTKTITISDSNIAYEDGAYVVTLSGLESDTLYSVTVSGVTDVYGDELTKTETFTTETIEPTKYGYRISDFEKYDVDTELFSGNGYVKSSDELLYAQYISGSTSYQVINEDGNKVMKLSELTSDSSTSKKLYFNALPDTSNMSGADYYVLSYKMRNGDADGKNAFRDFVQSRQFRGVDGKIYYKSLVSSDINGNTSTGTGAYNVGAYNQYTFVGNVAAKQTDIYINGTYLATTAPTTMFNDAGSFFSIQFMNDSYAIGNVYVDDIETYALKKSDLSQLCTLSSDSGDLSVVNTTTKVAISALTKVTVDNDATVTSVTSDNGTFKIQLGNLVKGTTYTVTVTAAPTVFTKRDTSATFSFVYDECVEFVSKELSGTTMNVVVKNLGTDGSNSRVIVACYDSEDDFVAVRTCTETELAKGTNTYSVDLSGVTAASYRVFVWNMSTLKPYFESK